MITRPSRASIRLLAGVTLVVGLVVSSLAPAAAVVASAPVITSADTASLAVGTSGSIPLTSTGSPAAVFSTTSTLPLGLSLLRNPAGSGTAVITGTPQAATIGTYSINLVATSSAGVANQTLTLTIYKSPVVSGSQVDIFTVGLAGTSYTYTSTASPAATLSLVGTLPAGLTFTATGTGAVIAGNAAVGSGGQFSYTIKASNGFGPATNYGFNLIVDQRASYSVVPTDQWVLAGSVVTFTSQASGYPTSFTKQWARLLYVNGVLRAQDIPGATGANYSFVTSAAQDGEVFRVTWTNSTGILSTGGATLHIGQLPAITSAASTTFLAGTPGSFTVHTTGAPAPAASSSTTLPGWLTLTDNHDGTGTLSGTPPLGSGGTYPLTIKASNGLGTPASQSFVLTVNQSPAISSAAVATFATGAAGTFPITTTGSPTASLSLAGTAPSWLQLVDHHDGTGTLTGTPPIGSAGSYTFSVQASNGIAPTGSQQFTLSVTGAPAITSADHVAFAAGSSDTFAVTSAGGYPAATAVSETGPLPAGVTLTADGAGGATLSGTPPIGAGGQYPITLHVTNGVTASDQSFVLTVNDAPQITSAADVSFTAGVVGNFPVTTTAGFPIATTVSVTGALPSGITFNPATAAFSGIPSGARDYPVTLTASNGTGLDATQSLVVHVLAATAVALPGPLPNSDGTLNGVPASTQVGQTLNITGSGFAAGAPVTLGIYSTPTPLGSAVADASGNFAATVTLPALVGAHTVVAAGITSTGAPQFLQRATLVSALVAPTRGRATTVTVLANTGVWTETPAALEFAVLLLLVGGALMVIARRRRYN